MRLLGAVLTSLNSRTGKDWLEDYDTWFQARVIAGALLDRVAPPSAEEEDLSRLHKKAFARKPDASAAEEWSRRDGEARARRLGLLENAAEQAAAVVLDLPKFTRTK